MAKNLKINIKNSQLAEALKLKKLKKAPKKEENEEKQEKKETSPSSEAPKKPAVKATKEPKLAAKRATAKPTAKPAAKTEHENKPAVDEKQPTIEQPPTREKEKKEPKPKIGSIRPGTEKKSKPKKEEKAVETKPSGEPKETPKKELAADKKEPKKKKEVTEGKPTAPKGFNKKGFGSQPTFDSRARQGLQNEDEGQWRRRRPGFKKHKKSSAEALPVVRPSSLTIKVPITIKDLAQAMKYKAAELIQKLFMQGITATINDYLEDETTIQLLGDEFGCAITIDTSEEQRLQITDKSVKEEIAEQKPDDLVHRDPIIAFMGHVDHGKTSLIDAIRKSNITAHEAGAITQHIGAFKCKTNHGYVTILDTPGHEAFSSMRSRGSEVTDIVVLVIAGDEGIKPQTVEAIEQALAADAELVVAINKCDKPNFNVDEVYRQLADKSLLPEAWGGDLITVNCSAVTKEGIPQLLEMLALQSEMLELKACPNMRARGAILESKLKKGLGATATLLVQNGTLRLGDALVIEHVYGRVKTMHDEHGKSLEEAPPSCPVHITGLSDLPQAGSEFIVVENEKEARKLCIDRKVGQEREMLKKSVKSLENLLQQNVEAQMKKELKIILKADMQGSLEAIKQSITKIPSKKAEVNIISSGVGEISESDIEYAAASNAIIVGFHTQIESHAESLIKQYQVKIKLHDIIYHLIDDLKEELVKLLDKVKKEDYAGTAEVKAIFKASSIGNIAGCFVTDGIIKKDHLVRVFRGKEQVFEGKMASLKRLQDDAKEVPKGLECGIVLQNFNKVQVGDEIKSYQISYLTQELE